MLKIVFDELLFQMNADKKIILILKQWQHIQKKPKILIIVETVLDFHFVLTFLQKKFFGNFLTNYSFTGMPFYRVRRM